MGKAERIREGEGERERSFREALDYAGFDFLGARKAIGRSLRAKAELEGEEERAAAADRIRQEMDQLADGHLGKGEAERERLGRAALEGKAGWSGEEIDLALSDERLGRALARMFFPGKGSARGRMLLMMLAAGFSEESEEDDSDAFDAPARAGEALRLGEEGVDPVEEMLGLANRDDAREVRALAEAARLRAGGSEATGARRPGGRGI